MIIIILLVILFIIYILETKYIITQEYTSPQENFYSCPCKSKKNIKYPYEPKISTPQTNYNEIISKINSQQIYKNDLSVALSPTPTINCPTLTNKTDCNKYGCNWFGSSNNKNSNSFCSSTYPTQI